MSAQATVLPPQCVITTWSGRFTFHPVSDPTPIVIAAHQPRNAK